MNIIITSDTSDKDFPDRKPFVLSLSPYKLWALAAVLSLILAAGVYAVAAKIAAHWLQNRSPIAITIAEEQAQQADAARRRLWEENIGELQNQIAQMRAQVIELQNRGHVIAERVGLPAEQFFAADQLNGCEVYPAISPPQNADEVAALDSANLHDMQNNITSLSRDYDILAEHSAQMRVLFNTIPDIRPLGGHNWKTSGFGPRRDPITGRRAFHAGYDYAAEIGTPVLAAADGLVTYSGRLGNYGKAIRISHGSDVSTLYGHLQASTVTSGQYVQRGEIIGSVGNTGRSTGPHLHYEVRLNNKPRPIRSAVKKLKEERGVPKDWGV